MNAKTAVVLLASLFLSSLLLVAPCAVARADEMTPAERARLDHDAMRATRHLDLYGSYVARVQRLQQTADALRAQPGATPAAERDRLARLRALDEVTIPQTRERTQELGRLWNDRWGIRLGPISRHGTTIPVPYLETDDASFPGEVRHRDTDYLRFRIACHFRVGEQPSAPPPAPIPTNALPPIPKEVEEAPETASDPVRLPSGETWDEATAKQRREALLANLTEAWNTVSSWFFGKDEGRKAEAGEALGDLPVPPPLASTPVTTGKESEGFQASFAASETARLAAIRKERAGTDPLAAWKAMTKEQRHEALLRNDPIAWDAVKALLTSGKAEDVKDVVAALDRVPKPPLPAGMPDPIGPTQGTITGLVSRPKGGGGSPFGDESLAERVVDATVSYSYLEGHRTVESTTRSDGEGRFEISVPLDVAVRLAWDRETQEVRCTFDRPTVSVSFGGPDIKSVPTGPTPPGPDPR